MNGTTTEAYTPAFKASLEQQCVLKGSRAPIAGTSSAIGKQVAIALAQSGAGIVANCVAAPN